MPMKLKHEVLKEFTAIMYKHDVMNRASRDPDEYEAEALSALARFCEAALQLSDDENTILELSRAIVAQTFEFWFDAKDVEGLELLTLELLKTYLDSFPSDDEQVPVVE